jgi:hypothetical protein
MRRHKGSDVSCSVMGEGGECWLASMARATASSMTMERSLIACMTTPVLRVTARG